MATESVAAGRQLFEAAVESLDELVGWLVDQPLDELWSKLHK